MGNARRERRNLITTMYNEFYEAECHSTTAIAQEDNFTDEDLMARIQRHDEQALGEIFHRHSRLLRTVISRVVNNEQDVDDLIQKVFLELWNQAAHYDPAKGKVLGWLVTLARRRAIDTLRRRQAHSRAAERMRTELSRVPVTVSDSVEDDVMADDAKEILQRIVSHLPPAQRDAIQLAYYQGMSQREIASRTGIPLGTIKTRLELAIGKVRNTVLALGGRNAWRQSSQRRCARHDVMPSLLNFA